MKISNSLCATAAAALMLLASSCGAPKQVAYMQDMNQGTYSMTVPPGDAIAVKARPGDKLQIIVTSMNPELSALFNLSRQENGTGSTSNRDLYYTVNHDGNIDFPVLGMIHVEGLTRQGIATEIKHQLVSRDLIKSPVVTVEFANTYVNVLGEVLRPGRYQILDDNITLIEGLAMAGDLTINGERRNVAVIRTDEKGILQVYRIDMTSADNLYNSPAFWLQQDDVIYVEPNDTRKRQSTASGNTVLTPAFWLSVGSFLLTLSVFIWK